MICHYVPQPKRRGSNVSTKCQVASLVSRSVSCVVFYLIIGVSKEQVGKEEVRMERDGKIGGLDEMCSEMSEGGKEGQKQRDRG